MPIISSNSAYGRPAGTHFQELTEVGPGSPMGELLRRYWHPVGLADDASSQPRPVRVLGEDLILFRNGRGRAGLLHPRCAHRGASLFYGRVEEAGIRCCYHGWLFDADGRCLEQPCEPSLGVGRNTIRQPAYPVEERYGLIFGYLGPPERQPILPRYDVLETLEPGEFIEADDSSIGSGGPAIVPCNWLQHFENVLDPFHVPILHGSFSGAQFIAEMAVMPNVRFEDTERGVRSLQRRAVEQGEHRRITEAVLPTVRAVADPRQLEGRCSLLGWVLPIDDTSFRIYSAGRVRAAGALKAIRSRFQGKLWQDLTEEEHQLLPGDYEAQVGQGPITLHSEEHLVSSDRGIAMLRRMFRRQLDALAADRDPVGVSYTEEEALVRIEAGAVIVANSV